MGLFTPGCTGILTKCALRCMIDVLSTVERQQADSLYKLFGQKGDNMKNNGIVLQYQLWQLRLMKASKTFRRTLIWGCILGTIFSIAGHQTVHATVESPPTALNPSTRLLQAQLQANAIGEVVVSTHPTTRGIRFIYTGRAGDLMPRIVVQAAADADVQQQQRAAKAAAFWSAYSALFGIAGTATSLDLVEANTDAYGASHLIYQQYYRGVPVYGGELRTHFARDGRLIAVNGIGIPVQKLIPTPAIRRQAASGIAQQHVARQKGIEPTTLQATTPELFIFQAGLAQGVPGTIHLAYRVEVTNTARSIRRFLFVDAHTSQIIETFNGIHEIDRAVSEETLGNVVWAEDNPEPIPSGWQGGTAAQVTAWNDEILGAKETYNLFGSLTNGQWLSYNGGDATMRTVNNDPNILCPNANWNGISTNYCNGVTGDDTVAHEWAHAYTEYTSDLVYAWQPGALNESFSDIWGEIVDLLNGRGSDSPDTVRTANSCSQLGAGSPANDNSYRWLSGEDDPGFGGAIRDMWNPSCYNDPGKVSDTNYHCTQDDSGGVHVNSGVPNHLFALLVDGGTYNGQTISALGLTRSAHLFWQAQRVYLGTFNDFPDLADALTASCTDLLNQPLQALSINGPISWGNVATEAIAADDCTTVANAIAAVELRTPPTQCGFQPLLQPTAPALCSGPDVVTTFALQPWENGLGDWQVGRRDLAEPGLFNIPDWSVAAALPNGRTGQAAFGPDPLKNGDSCNSPTEAGVIYLQSPPFPIPVYAAAPRLAFDHWMASEDGWDGGNVSVRVNNGAWTLITGDAFLHNPYNNTLLTIVDGNINPLAGLPAFTGADGGATTGSWGQSQIDLSGYAQPGDLVELRFEFGLDGCAGLIGWYVDDVHLYACTIPPDLQVQKSVDITSTLPGQPIHYTLTFSRAGIAPAAGVIITDTLPGALHLDTTVATGATFTPITTTSVMTTSVMTASNWVWTMLDPGGSLQPTLGLTVTVDPALNSDQTITNTVFFTATGDPVQQNNQASVSINVVLPRVGLTNSPIIADETAGTVPVTVTLDQPNPFVPIRIDYTVISGTAHFDTDILSATGTITLSQGITQATIPIGLADDGITEPSEQFEVALTAAQGALITRDRQVVTIVDDDVAGIRWLPVGGITDEDGGIASITVTLTSEPTAPVTLTFTSADQSEGMATPLVTFAPEQWNIGHSVVITGVDDQIDDGTVAYTITTQLTTTDVNYAALTPPVIPMQNLDNDVVTLTASIGIFAPIPTPGEVLTYTYAITNSGTITVSELAATDSHFGALVLPQTTLGPGLATRLNLTRTITTADLNNGIKHTVKVTGLSVGSNSVRRAASIQVNLLDVEADQRLYLPIIQR